VLDEFRGRGISAVLAGIALDDARQQGLKFVPSCSYRVGFIERKPGYADLVECQEEARD
jgi:predicted GNAT family acetyltransferase